MWRHAIALLYRLVTHLVPPTQAVVPALAKVLLQPLPIQHWLFAPPHEPVAPHQCQVAILAVHAAARQLSALVADIARVKPVHCLPLRLESNAAVSQGTVLQGAHGGRETSLRPHKHVPYRCAQQTTYLVPPIQPVVAALVSMLVQLLPM